MRILQLLQTTEEEVILTTSQQELVHTDRYNNILYTGTIDNSYTVPQIVKAVSPVHALVILQLLWEFTLLVS